MGAAAAQRYLHKWISPSQTTLIHPFSPHCLSDITYFVVGEVWRFLFLYWSVCYSLMIKKRLCSKKAYDEIMSLFDKENTSKTYPYEVLILRFNSKIEGIWWFKGVVNCKLNSQSLSNFLFVCRFGCNQQMGGEALKVVFPHKWPCTVQYVRTHMTIEE